MTTKTKPVENATETEEERAELQEVLQQLFGDPSKPAGRLRGAFVKVRYVLSGKTSTFFGRTQLLTASIAVQHLDARLQQQYGIRLRVSHNALLRVIELSDPGGPGPGLSEVLSCEVEAPAEKLIRSGRAKRGDAIGVRRNPLGKRVQLGVVGE